MQAENNSNARKMTARLLRVIAADLSQRIIPDLKSADAIERATLTRMVVLTLAADLDVLPKLAAQSLPDLAQLLQQANTTNSEPSLDQVATLRDQAAHSIQSSAAAADRTSLLAQLGRWDADWVLGLESAVAARESIAAAAAGASGTTEVAGETVTVDNVNAYLRRCWPDQLSLKATAVVPIPGGRSKKTFFITTAGSDALPVDLVLRQDYSLKYAGTKVAEEYRPLLALSGLGLPVPKPLHLENEVSELGPPFLLVNRLSGKPPGTYFSQSVNCPGAFRELATMLGRLHRVEPLTLGFPSIEPGKDYLLALIQQYRAKWRDNATRSSPVIDFAYLWAEQQCALSHGSAAFVHGDAGPYNFLADGDQLTAILDWEFAHVGDPAEDLGIARVYAESCLPWQKFLDIYRRAGGPEVSDRRVQLGMLMQFLKGTTLTAASGRNFLEGATDELVKGASSFTGLRMIEPRLARLLKRFGAV